MSSVQTRALVALSAAALFLAACAGESRLVPQQIQPAHNVTTQSSTWYPPGATPGPVPPAPTPVPVPPVVTDPPASQPPPHGSGGPQLK
jgi:hypothetical protein